MPAQYEAIRRPAMYSIIEATNFRAKDSVVPISNESPRTGSIMPERYNSITVPIYRPISLPEFGTMSEPKRREEEKQTA